MDGIRLMGGKGVETYHCVDFIHDGILRCLNRHPCPHESNIPIDVAAVGLRDVDFAASGLLHVFDRFAAFADDHAHGFRRNDDVVVDLFVVSSVHATLSSASVAVGVLVVLIVAVDDLGDQGFGHGGGLRGADEVDGSLTIDAFLFADDVDVTSAPLLKVSDGFATSSDDESNGAIRDQDLIRVLTRSQGWRM